MKNPCRFSGESALRASAGGESAIDRSDRALEKAQARIEKLESRTFWKQVLGPLAFVAALAFGGGR